ncbi:MAG: RNA polymerase sigma factor [Aggregatilineales bacterium]
MDEREAIARLKAGYVDGLEPLVRTYQLRALRAAYLVTGDRALAEDVVQEAFLRLMERIRGFDDQRPFAPWFLRSLVNDAVKAVTRRKPYVSLDADLTRVEAATLADVLADDAPGPVELAETADVAQQVRQALDKLPPDQRAAIVLRYYLNLDENEIGQQLNRPIGTIKWRLHTARKQLQILLRNL